MRGILRFVLNNPLAVLCSALFLALMLTPAAGAAPLVLIGITSTDLTTMEQALKDVFDPVIADQQNKAAMTWKEFDEGSDQMDIGGKGWVGYAPMGGNQEGIAARKEGGALPVAGRQRGVQYRILWKYTYGTFEITGPAIEASKTDAMAFARLKVNEIKGLTGDMIKDYNRMAFGDGTGKLATVTADGPNVNTFYVDDPKYLRLNMMIDVWNSTTNAINSRQITAIASNATGWFVTYDGADVAASANWIVRREDNAYYTGSAWEYYEMDGLQKMVDDGTVAAIYNGITRATWPLWSALVLDNAGTARAISADLLQQMQDHVYRASGEEPDWIRTGTGQRRKYFDLCAPDRRYMTGQFDAGYERLDFNSKKLTVDPDCPSGWWFMLRRAAIKKYTVRPFGVMDIDGRVLRQVSGYDKYNGFLGMYANLATKHPNWCAAICDCTEPTEQAIIS